MAVYKMIIEYDGTGFSGFQSQTIPGVKTIQDELESILSKIFDHTVRIHAAGRTDAGVHATGQVVHFKTDKIMPVKNLQRALNRLLKGDISIRKMEIAPDEFHARFSATKRKYVYLLDNSQTPCAFYKNRAYWFPMKLDISLMREACSYLVGKHDFSLFVKNLKEIDNPVRTIDKACIYTAENLCIDAPIPEISSLFRLRDNFIFFYYEARSFLHSQVRLMTGNLIEVGRGKLAPSDIKKMLDLDTSIKSAAMNIPAGGLYLVGVDYEKF